MVYIGCVRYRRNACWSSWATDRLCYMFLWLLFAITQSQFSSKKIHWRSKSKMEFFWFAKISVSFHRYILSWKFSWKVSWKGWKFETMFKRSQCSWKGLLEISLSWKILCWRELSNLMISHVKSRTWKELSNFTIFPTALLNFSISFQLDFSRAFWANISFCAKWKNELARAWSWRSSK